MRALKHIREKKSLTLRKLAELSGLGASTIGNYETGKTGMSQESLAVLAKCLNSTVEEISAEISAETRPNTFWRSVILDRLEVFNTQELLDFSEICLASNDIADIEAGRMILAEVQFRMQASQSQTQRQ